MDEATVKARVQQHVASGDFSFPEDLARGVAEALGVDTAGTNLGQDPAAESKTRGSVPPFSGRPATEEHGTKESNKAVEKFDKLVQERDVEDPNVRARITRADLGVDENDGLETEVKESGPIYPKDDSGSTAKTTSSAKTSSK